MKWTEAGLLWCCILTWVLLPFFPPLKKAVRACIGEKNPLNFLSGSHSGYMIKKECIPLSRPWLTWPGEILGPMIPWEWDKLEFGLFPVRPHCFGQRLPSQLCCFSVTLHKFLNFLVLPPSAKNLNTVIYPCLTGLRCGLFAPCRVIPWWKQSCKLW